MSRSRTRISRGLIGILAIVLVLGLVAYFHNTSKTKATELAKNGAPSDPTAPGGKSVTLASLDTKAAPRSDVPTPTPSLPAPPPGGGATNGSPTTAPTTQPLLFASAVK